MLSRPMTHQRLLKRVKSDVALFIPVCETSLQMVESLAGKQNLNPVDQQALMKAMEVLGNLEGLVKESKTSNPGVKAIVEKFVLLREMLHDRFGVYQKSIDIAEELAKKDKLSNLEMEALEEAMKTLRNLEGKAKNRVEERILRRAADVQAILDEKYNIDEHSIAIAERYLHKVRLTAVERRAFETSMTILGSLERRANRNNPKEMKLLKKAMAIRKKQQDMEMIFEASIEQAEVLSQKDTHQLNTFEKYALKKAMEILRNMEGLGNPKERKVKDIMERTLVVRKRLHNKFVAHSLRVPRGPKPKTADIDDPSSSQTKKSTPAPEVIFDKVVEAPVDSSLQREVILEKVVTRPSLNLLQIAEQLIARKEQEARDQQQLDSTESTPPSDKQILDMLASPSLISTLNTLPQPESPSRSKDTSPEGSPLGTVFEEPDCSPIDSVINTVIKSHSTLAPARLRPGTPIPNEVASSSAILNMNKKRSVLTGSSSTCKTTDSIASLEALRLQMMSFMPSCSKDTMFDDPPPLPFPETNNNARKTFPEMPSLAIGASFTNNSLFPSLSIEQPPVLEPFVPFSSSSSSPLRNNTSIRQDSTMKKRKLPKQTNTESVKKPRTSLSPTDALSPIQAPTLTPSKSPSSSPLDLSCSKPALPLVFLPVNATIPINVVPSNMLPSHAESLNARVPHLSLAGDIMKNPSTPPSSNNTSVKVSPLSSPISTSRTPLPSISDMLPPRYLSPVVEAAPKTIPHAYSPRKVKQEPIDHPSGNIFKDHSTTSSRHSPSKSSQLPSSSQLTKTSFKLPPASSLLTHQSRSPTPNLEQRPSRIITPEIIEGKPIVLPPADSFFPNGLLFSNPSSSNMSYPRMLPLNYSMFSNQSMLPYPTPGPGHPIPSFSQQPMYPSMGTTPTTQPFIFDSLFPKINSIPNNLGPLPSLSAMIERINAKK